MSTLDLPTAASLVGAAVDAHVLRAVASAGLTGVRIRHGYVFQRLIEAPATATELAAAAGVTQQAMSKTLRELLAEGYVEPWPDPVDGRRRPVAVTDRGREAVARALSARLALDRAVCRRVGDEAMSVTSGVLDALLDVLGLSEQVASRSVRATATHWLA